MGIGIRYRYGYAYRYRVVALVVICGVGGKILEGILKRWLSFRTMCSGSVINC
jgi:tRNA A22 N-methylase